MNKSQFRKNVNTKININALAGRLANKRILIANSVPVLEQDLRKYFDVIITEDVGVLNTLKADIFVETCESPYMNHIFDCARFEDNPNTLFCVNYKMLAQLKKTNKKVNAYMLAFAMADRLATGKPSKVGALEIGMSSKEPCLDVAMIGGATDIYSTEISSHGIYMGPSELDAFVKESMFVSTLGVMPGVPKNVLHKKRKNLVEGWA